MTQTFTPSLPAHSRSTLHEGSPSQHAVPHLPTEVRGLVGRQGCAKSRVRRSAFGGVRRSASSCQFRPPFLAHLCIVLLDKIDCEMRFIICCFCHRLLTKMRRFIREIHFSKSGTHSEELRRVWAPRMPTLPTLSGMTWETRTPR